jgi:hypothetical protein
MAVQGRLGVEGAPDEARCYDVSSRADRPVTSSPIPLTARFRPKPSLLVRHLEGEAVLLDLDTGRYFGLNGSGRRILELMDGERSLAEIRQRLAGEFDAPAEELSADLAGLVDELGREGLLLRVD